jgi:Glutamine amidotransferase
MRPGTKPRIAVVDYGMGNLASVAKALERSGADVRVTESAAAEIGRASCRERV